MNLIYYNIIRMVGDCNGWRVRDRGSFSLLKVVGEYCKLKYENKLVLDLNVRGCEIIIRDGKCVHRGFCGWGMSKFCKITIRERGTCLIVFVRDKDFMKWVRVLCREDIYDSNL